MRTSPFLRGLVAAAGAFAALASASVSARDVVGLRHGSYVQADTACAASSNATTQTFTGRGFDTAAAAQCAMRPLVGKPGTYAQTCTDYGAPAGTPKTRSTETLKLRLLSRTSYTVDGTTFRLCRGAR